MDIGFDSKKYLDLQYANIQKKLELFNGKLYLEFGGKIFDDLHAARVLPGFEPNIKIQLLKKLQDQSEIIIVVSAIALQQNKVRADFNITYADEVLRLTDNLRAEGLSVSAIVITLFSGQLAAQQFGQKLQNRGETVYFHKPTKGYPADIDTVVSDEGYGANPFIKTTKKLVVITAPGPNSGKLATALSQLYHENKHGVSAGYAKYETFPVWNLPIHHPVNIAYEAATADLNDKNLPDFFHFEAYGEQAVNYNRDLEAFPLLKKILEKIGANTSALYLSPTDMGVNMIASAITDDNAVSQSANQEIIRRFYQAQCAYQQGLLDETTCIRTQNIMQNAGLSADMRSVAKFANQKYLDTGCHTFALQFADGSIVSGRTKTLSAVCACVLNAIKLIAGIEDAYDIIPESIIRPIIKLNKDILRSRSELLSLKDILLALSVSATTNNKAQKALEALKKLRGLEAHSTYILPQQDEKIIKELGIWLTSEPKFASNNLFE